MDQLDIITMANDMLLTSALLAAPILGIGLAVGLTVSIFQALTQINEMTLTFVPKIIAVGLVIFIFLPWMITIMTDYTLELFTGIPRLIR